MYGGDRCGGCAGRLTPSLSACLWVWVAVQYLDSGGVEGGGGMSTLSLVRGDGGVSLAVIRYMEALAFVASTPSR